MPELWDNIKQIDKTVLKLNSINQWMPAIKKQWPFVKDYYEKITDSERRSAEKYFTSLLLASQKTESTRTRKTYEQRIEELKKSKDALYIEKIRQYLQNELIKLQQSSLFTDMELNRVSRIKEIETNIKELISTKTDYLIAILEQEMDRNLSTVIPRRYKVGYFDVQPLGVELIINKSLLTED